MELEKVEKELREKWQEEFQDKSKIISLLNTFGNTVNKNCKPLEYSKEDDFVLFKLAKERLRYIQDFSEDNSENSIEHLSCFAFRALFFGTDDFKLENVDEHIKQFQVIIDCLSKIENKDQTNLFNSLIDKIDEKYKGNVLSLFKELFPKNFFIFIGLLILTNESNLFLEVLFRQIQNSFDVKYDFEYEDISKLPLEQAINDLCEIMINSEKNLIHLKLDEGHFQSYSFNNDEILEVLDSLNDEQKEKKDRIKSIIEKKKKKVTSKGKKQSLNKINEKLPSQNVEKGERSINEKNNNAIELNLNINNENSNINCERQIVIQKEDDKQEQKEDDKQDEDDKQEEDNKQKEDDKQEQKENDKKKENDKQEQKEGDKQERQEDDKQKKQEDDEQSIMNEMKKIKNKLKNMEMSISNNEQKIKSLEESNQKLEESNQKLVESNQKLEKSNKKLEKSNQKLKKNIEQLKLDSTNFSNKVDKLESQLDTIKMRDGIKAFIDYIFASLKLAAKIGYESKIYMIYITLNKKSKDYNQHLIKNIKFILYTVFKKLNIGNEFAHNVDLNSSIVDQMFELIKDNDNEEKLKETKIEFQKTNMDRVIKKLIQVRKENYNKPIEVRENEEKNVLSEVKDLDLILKIY